MNDNTVQLWCAYPTLALADETALACKAILSADELARMQAFRFERLRMEYLTTRVLVRTALSHECGVAPGAWRFRANAYGKPMADPECGLRFNLSNCPGLVVCLIAHEAEVGVDVEPYDRAESIAEVSSTVFSPKELAQLASLCEAEKLDRALSLWTLKEAYIKARGMGLSLPLKKFSFLFGGVEGVRLELDPCMRDHADRWRFCLIEHAGHRIALVAERNAALNLQIWEARPTLAPPVRMADAGESWFPASQV